MNLPSFRVLVLTLPLVSSAHAATTYKETFPNSGGSNASHTSVGWFASYSTNATDGSGNIVNNANGGFVVSNLAAGYGAKTTSGSTYGLAYTTEVTANNITTTDITGITFLARNAVITDRFRVVIAVDVAGDIQWYASDAFFTTSAGTWTGGSGAELQTLPFTLNASNWRMLTYAPDNMLAVSDSTLTSDLPIGNVGAVGLFLSGNNDGEGGTSGGAHQGTMRYDDFTVNVIPEPSTAILGTLGVLALAFRKRRH